MNSRIKILYLENDPLDFERISAVLRHHGLLGDLTRVESQSDFLRALDTQAFDLVLSDYQLRGFSSRWALEEVKKRLPGVPFIFVSRAIGEESAIELLKIGASDYVAKEHCTRLISSIQQALRQAVA
ncbi:MAG TPA: response regulator, partial [Candidatus Paceibacterota bacterium]|nr:response regulator [Candidatus Paceibacterota bacterium]